MLLESTVKYNGKELKVVLGEPHNRRKRKSPYSANKKLFTADISIVFGDNEFHLHKNRLAFTPIISSYKSIKTVYAFSTSHYIFPKANIYGKLPKEYHINKKEPVKINFDEY